MTIKLMRMIQICLLFLFLLESDAVGQSNIVENVGRVASSKTNLRNKKPPMQNVDNPEDPFTVRLRERKTPLPPPPELDPRRINDTKYVAEMWWEQLGYISKEEAAESLKNQKKIMEDGGLKWIPMQPGNPDYVEDHFEMPLNEALPHCSYTPGYTYPDVCHDEKGNRIFDSEIDGQEVLDKVVKKYGKQGGKYHKMPKVKPKLGWMSETMYGDDKKD